MKNREIKFRAWKNETMYNVDTLGLIESGIEENSSFAHEPRNPIVKSKEIRCELLDDAIFMQFTGLKDLKEVDIYEGDILKWVGSTGERIGEIFHNQVYWYQYKWRIKGTKNGKTFHADFTLNQCFNHKVEVIGNIHENPELL